MATLVVPRPASPARRRLELFEDSLDSRFARLVASPALPLLLTGALVAALVAFAAAGLAAPLRTDYLAMLTGSRLLGSHGCLYCAAAQMQAQHQLLGTSRAAFDPFLESPPVALAFAPLLGLTPGAGYALFLAASAAVAAAGLLLLWRGLTGGANAVRGVVLLAAAALTLPADWNAALGQTDALLLLPAAAGAVLLNRRRDVASGLVLSLLLLKPQSAWLLLPLLLAARRPRCAAALVAGAAALAATSLAIAGPGALMTWISLAASQGPALATGLGLPAPASLAGGVPAALTAAGAGGAATAAIAWRLRSQLAAAPCLAVAMGITCSVLLAPHVYAYDLALMAVPLLVLGVRRPGVAVTLALLLDVAHVVDGYLIAAGMHAETAVLLLLGTALLAELRPATDCGPDAAGPPPPGACCRQPAAAPISLAT